MWGLFGYAPFCFEVVPNIEIKAQSDGTSNVQDVEEWKPKWTIEEQTKFREKYCMLCGSQQCTGYNSYIEGCYYYKREFSKYL